MTSRSLYPKLSPSYVSDAIRSSISSRDEAHTVAHDTMRDIVDSATDLMVKNHFDRAAIPYTVQGLRHEMLDVIEAVFQARDSGVSVMPSPGWVAPRQPERVLVDTWARGVVTVRPRHEEEQLQQQQQQTAITLLGTVSGGKGSLGAVVSGMVGGRRSSKVLDRSAVPAAAATTNTATIVAQSIATKAPKQLRDGGSKPAKKKKKRDGVDGDQQQGGASPDAVSDAVSESDTREADVEEEEYETALRAEERRRLEAKAMSERVTAQMEEIKHVVGRDGAFTLEAHTGQVVAIRSLEPVRMPSKKVELRVNVGHGSASAHDDQAQLDQQQQQNSKQGGGAAQKKKQKPAVMAREPPPVFVHPDQVTGPMIDGLAPSGGVAVKEGDVSRRSDYRVPKSKVTRADFRKIMDSQATVSQMIDDGTASMASVATPSVAATSVGKRVPVPPPGVKQQQGQGQRRGSAASNVSRNALDDGTQSNSNNNGTGAMFRAQKLAELPKQRHATGPAITATTRVKTGGAGSSTAASAVPERSRQKRLQHSLTPRKDVSVVDGTPPPVVGSTPPSGVDLSNTASAGKPRVVANRDAMMALLNDEDE